MINFKIKFPKFNKKSEEEPEDVTRVESTPEQIDEALRNFTAAITDIDAVQKRIEVRSAAMDALFVRRFKKFHSVQDYLDFLKVMKFKDTYKEFAVDLDCGDLVSIDAFCKSALLDDYQKEYWPLSLVGLKVEEPENKEEKTEESDADKAEDKAAEEPNNKEVKVDFSNIIKKEDNTNEGAIKFEEEAAGSKGEAERKDASSEDGAGERAGSDVSEVLSGGSSGDRTRDMRDRSSEAGNSNSAVLDQEKQERKRKVEKIANLVKKYVEKGTEITVSHSKYHNGGNIGTYDLTLKDKSGTRIYVLDDGSMVPGKIGVIVTAYDGSVISVPLIKHYGDMIRKIFGSVYTLTQEDFERVFNRHYLPDINIINPIDLTDALFITNMNADNRRIFAKNLMFVVNSLRASTGKNMRWRITRFKWIDDFTLTSDSKCVSPIPGYTTANEIGFIDATYKKDQDIIISESEIRPAPQMEVKDQRAA